MRQGFGRHNTPCRKLVLGDEGIHDVHVELGRRGWLTINRSCEPNIHIIGSSSKVP